MGFCNLENFNIAVLAKKGWKLVCNSSSLVTRVLKEKYYVNNDFLEVELGSEPSVVWRSIWAVKELLMKGCSLLVNDESSISMWDMPWLSGDRPCKLSSPRVNRIVKVVDLIDEQSQTWKEDMVLSMFDYQEARRIISIQLVQKGVTNKLRWCLESFDEYTLRNGYKILLMGFPKTQEDSYSSIIKKPGFAPDVVKTLKPIDMQAVIVHLPYRFGRILELTGGGIKIRTLLLIRLDNYFLGAVISKKLIVIIAIWAIWFLRNKLVNEGKQQSKTEIVTFIFGYIRELELLIGERVERVAEETVAWRSPLKPFFRVNFDVGFYELQAASTGIIIRNSTGLIMGAAYLWNRYVLNASVEKALAGTQAFRFTQELGFLAIEFEGESLVVITKLRAACIDRSEISNHMWEAKVDCAGF
ncbi:hypothetical protein Gotri_025600 [Gossypium trilobum]|uniref:RNase H type-1 domain-containing protein n=1 Tax=Gossypium trilobum TaxID=34281 RepID=A0A7J9FPD7_9ROSI|nr:hypothetical protein [Gossypium trilobum]